MGTVFRKTVTRPLPAGAELFMRKGERFARWKDHKGKTRTAPLTIGKDGQNRIADTAATFTAKYRDGQNVVREVATGCKDETAARSVLADLERRAELVKANVLTVNEDAVSDHQATPLPVHFDAYGNHQKVKGLNATRIKNTKTRLNRLATECHFKRLADLNADALAHWLAAQASLKTPMSPGTRNEYRQELVGFGNWCVKTRRLMSNPFRDVPRADAKSNPSRKRRSMTEAELIRLLEVARSRPLQEALTIRRGKQKGKAVAQVRKEVRAELERVGWERALIYKTLLLTGLRKGELASLTVGQLHLDEANAFAELYAADEKNRQGSEIAIRSDLADDLRMDRQQAGTLPKRNAELSGARLPINDSFTDKTPQQNAIVQRARWVAPNSRSRLDRRRYRED